MNENHISTRRIFDEIIISDEKVNRHEIDERDHEEYYYVDTVFETNTSTTLISSDTITITTTTIPSSDEWEDVFHYHRYNNKGEEGQYSTDSDQIDSRRKLEDREEEQQWQGCSKPEHKNQSSKRRLWLGHRSRRHQGIRHRLNAEYNTRHE
ncbi:hypothetical protein DINM_000424 [Dirofilaria immitis]|nr:hypothetical protein [Dirofilaria immitis]